jgi:hypothetical protein
MYPRKWAAIASLVPMFGLLDYTFERDDRMNDSDDAGEMFVDRAFKIYKPRADDVS